MLTSTALTATSTSCYKAKGLSLAEIMKSAGWPNSSTFVKFHDQPVDTATANFWLSAFTPFAVHLQKISIRLCPNLFHHGRCTRINNNVTFICA